MTKTIGEVCRIIGGGTPSKKKPEYYEGDIPWASVRDMNVRVIRDTEYKITETAVAESATNIIPKGEVVISTHVGLGKVCVLGQDTAINQDLKAVIPVGDLSRWYLYYWFLSKADLLVANGKGATVKGVTVDFVKRLKINIPSLERQAEIVAALDAAQELIDNSESQLAKLDQLVKSRFVEIFGEGENASRWPLATVGSVFTVGGPKRIHKSEWRQNGVPFLKISDLMARLDGGGTKSDCFISCERYEELRRDGQVPKTGDVLVTARGTLGRCYVVRPEDRFYFQDGMITWLSERSEKVELAYFLQAMKSDAFVRQYEGRSPGTTVAYLTISQLAKLRLPLPPIDLQREFAAFVAEVDKSEFAVRKRLEKARQLYRSKLQEYFR